MTSAAPAASGAQRKTPRCLVICPGGDPAANTAASWAKAAFANIPEAFIVSPPPRTAYRPADLCPVPVDWIFYFGHGRVDKWIRLGPPDGEEVTMDFRKAPHLGGLNVCAIACKTAHTLGPYATRNRHAAMYVGCKTEIAWSKAYPASGRACAMIARELVRSIIDGTLSKPVLVALVERHYKYWRDLEIRGDAEASRAIDTVNDWANMVVL